MGITIEIAGMSCEHCEKRVKNALEKVDGVKVLSISAVDSKAVIVVKRELDMDLIRAAIDKAGYELVE